MARKPRQTEFWPCWFYNQKGEGKIFNSAAEIPEGYFRKKPLPYTPVPPLQVNREVVIAELIERGVPIDPRWGSAHLQKVLDSDQRTSR